MVGRTVTEQHHGMETADHLGGYLAGGDPDTLYPDMWDWLVDTWEVKSVIDIGCGDAPALSHFLSRGIRAVGVDGMPPTHELVTQHDYTTGPYVPNGEFDLAWSAEFVEHVDEVYVPNFMATFRRARFAAITHAEPGCPGWHHVNCVVEGTPVRSTGAERAFRRGYCGDVVSLVTANGCELTVTPNHPVLTSEGWIAAGLLKQGMYLISSGFKEGMSGGVMPHTEYRPAVVEEVFGALAEETPPTRHAMSESGEDFHGDGSHGDVDVVGTDRLLRHDGLDAAILQHHDQLTLNRGLMRDIHLTRERAGVKSLRAKGPHERPGVRQHLSVSLPLHIVRQSPSRLIPAGGYRDTVARENVLHDGNGMTEGRSGRAEGRRPLPLFEDRPFIYMKPRAFSLRPNDDSSGGEVPLGSPEVSVGAGRELCERLTGQVSTDELVSVKRSDYVGHVYNLSTAEEAYLAGGIVVHNCRSDDYWKGVFAASGFEFDEGLTAMTRALSSKNERPFNHYRRSGLAFRRRGV